MEKEAITKCIKKLVSKFAYLNNTSLNCDFESIVQKLLKDGTDISNIYENACTFVDNLIKVQLVDNKNYQLLDEIIENTKFKKKFGHGQIRSQLISYAKILEYLENLGLSDNEEIINYIMHNLTINKIVSSLFQNSNKSLDELFDLYGEKVANFLRAYCSFNGIDTDLIGTNEQCTRPIERGKLTNDIIEYRKMEDGYKKQFFFNQIIKENNKLIYKVARSFTNSNYEFDDAYQNALIGFTEAIAKFDERYNSFVTYALWYMRKSVLRNMHNYDSQIRIPVYIKSKIPLYNKSVSKLESILSRRPTIDEIAEESGLSKQMINQINMLPKVTISINKKIGEDESTEVGEILVDNEKQTIEEDYEDKESHEKLIKMIEETFSDKPNYKDILIMRFGLDGNKPRTLEEIAIIYGLTRERIRQIENNSIKKLRQVFLKEQALFNLKQYQSSIIKHKNNPKLVINTSFNSKTILDDNDEQNTNMNGEVLMEKNNDEIEMNSKEKKVKAKPKKIFGVPMISYFKNDGYTYENLKSAIQMLSPKTKKIITGLYGENLEKIVYSEDIKDQKEKLKIYYIYSRIATILKESKESSNNKEQVQLKENDDNYKNSENLTIAEKRIQATPTSVINKPTKIENKDEQATLIIMKRFLQSNLFKELTKKLPVEDCVIMSLKLGYVGRNFSTDEISTFTGISKERIQNCYTRGLDYIEGELNNIASQISNDSGEKAKTFILLNDKPNK